MNDQMIEGVSKIFKIDKSILKELCKTKDLYSAASELSGVRRYNIKSIIHIYSYSFGRRL